MASLPSIDYPNLPGLIQGSYTASHGISPGVIQLRTQVGSVVPASGGTIVISDGINPPLPLLNCRIERFTQDQTGTGVDWIFVLSDTRWQWKYTVASGWFNQLDPQGKLIPRTVRSPYEIMVFLLTQMGVENYTIDAPPGLSSKDVAQIPGFLPSGINFPIVGINPPMDFYGENASVILAQFCEQCGRRVIYDPFTNAVTITIAGTGQDLPDGSIAAQTLTITAPETPDVVVVLGSPTRYQGLWDVGMAMGEDWNGQIKPIDALTYAPIVGAAQHTVTCKINDPVNINNVYDISIGFQGGIFTASHQVSSGGETSSTVAAALLTIIQNNLASAPFNGQITASVTSNVITLTATKNGPTFLVGTLGNITVTLVTQGNKGKVSWEQCLPPSFAGVRATDRLTYFEAQAKARKSVYKYYKMTGLDVSTRTSPMMVPGYGPVTFIDDVILSDSMVEQVVPDPGDQNFLVETGGGVAPLVRQYYDGYSHDRKAFCYGAIAFDIVQHQGLTYVGDGTPNNPFNTKVDDVIPVDFVVNDKFQCICFEDYVYRQGEGDKIHPASPILSCAAQIRDPVTRQLTGYSLQQVINPKAQTIYTVKRPDVQLNVYGVYKLSQAISKDVRPRFELTKTNILDQDPLFRANFYLTAVLNEIMVKVGKCVKYNGLVPITLDGATTQITWEVVGGEGCNTIVSQNSEHDPFIPPYPQRRKAENLGAVDRVVNPKNRNDFSGQSDGKAFPNPFGI
jgi:hypothetical protein